MKTELNRARTHSAKLREEVRLMTAGLVEEQKKDKEKLEKLEEEIKSLYELLMVKDEDNKQLIETRVLELEATIKRLKDELSTKKSKELGRICYQIDEDSSILQESFEKISEELLTDCNNNAYNESICSEQELRLYSPREEIVVVSRIPNALDCDNSLSSLERQENTRFHDRATSPGELAQFKFEGKLKDQVKAKWECSRIIRGIALAGTSSLQQSLRKVNALL